jgi:O-methyltransferase domain/Dimerisation domain
MREHGTQEFTDQVPPLAMLRMVTGYWASQAIYVAAKLGIADLLKDGPRSCDDLARATRAHPESLDRLMRALASIGVFTTKEDLRFELTAVGACLQSGVLGSMRAMAVTLGEEHYHAWGNLLYSIRTGQPAFNHAYERGLFKYFVEKADAANIFNQAMADVTALVCFAVILAYDFSSISTVVDVGGGHGTLISSILKANPRMRGILFDSSPVIEEAKKHMNGDGLAERCELIAGDFFQSVPSGSDAYVLKNILHDWGDEQCVTILKNCRIAMAENSRVILVETVIPPEGGPSFDRLQDLNMLVMCGGRERSEGEYHVLFDAAGLKLARIVPTLSPMSLIEGMSK